MRILVIGGDYWHPFEVVRRGLAGLPGAEFDLSLIHICMAGIEQNAVFIIIHIGGILQKPVFAQQRNRDQAMVTPGRLGKDVYKRQGYADYRIAFTAVSVI